jgi:hypothetical protein
LRHLAVAAGPDLQPARCSGNIERRGWAACVNGEIDENIGPKSRQWLAEAGIYTLTDLRKAGAITTYTMLKERYPKKVSLNLL